jgi:nitrate reductase gamma subunit
MATFNAVAFVVFPYIALTVLVAGYSYRYITDLFD